MQDSTLPGLLRGLRKSHKMTQAQVAEHLGIVQQAYSHYEKGIRTPDTRTLLRLAKLYGIDPSELLQNAYLQDGSGGKASGQPGMLGDMIGFYAASENQAKYRALSHEEKELLFYFHQLKPADRQELTEIAKLKVKLKQGKK